MARMEADVTAFKVKGNSGESAEMKNVAVGIDFERMTETQLKIWADILYPIGSLLIVSPTSGTAFNPNNKSGYWPFYNHGAGSNLEFKWEALSQDRFLKTRSADNTSWSVGGDLYTSKIYEDNLPKLTKTTSSGGGHKHSPAGDGTQFWTTNAKSTRSEGTKALGGKTYKLPCIDYKYSNYSPQNTTSNGDHTHTVTFGGSQKNLTINPSFVPVVAWRRVA